MMNALRNAIRKFRSAHATEGLFKFCGLHITKLHVYGSVAGTLALQDFHEGHFTYSLGVLALAALDMADDI
jgi:hypothetical protein